MTPAIEKKPNGKRRSILDLAPLELECLRALWPMGEATVHDIRDRLAEIRPRAYTTIMTIMDRLARKGVLTRRKFGRAWLYSPNLSAGEARAHAVAQLVESFFNGSREALASELGSPAVVTAAPPRRIAPPPAARRRPAKEAVEVAAPEPPRRTSPAIIRIDDTLL